MGYHRSGFISAVKRERARVFLDSGQSAAALRLLAGACYGTGYDVDYFELFGRALLECGQVENAGRFFFLSGVRRSEYEAAITKFLNKHNDPNNFRQLQSHFPKRAQVLWHLKQFPPIVGSELRSLGWPEDIQSAIIERKQFNLQGE
jgi:hypothetical protein